MSYASDREEFIYRMATLGVRLHESRAILRDASIVQREAELACSINRIGCPSLLAYTARAERAEKRIYTLLMRRDSPVWVEFGGDPRGYCVRFRPMVKSDENTNYAALAVQTEHGVPAKGWTARDLERFAHMTSRAQKASV